MRDEVWKMSSVCKEAGIRFAEDLTKEDRLLRRELWPRIEQARKEGKAAALEARLDISTVNVFRKKGIDYFSLI